MASPVDLLLASKSPRRRELLTAAGIAFALCEPGAEYVGDGTEHDSERGDPKALATERARRKALGATALDGLDGVSVLAVDTVVDLDGEELGKAVDEHAARRMLGRLAGRRHAVHTAHCLARPGGRFVEELSTSFVRCDEPDERRLQRYLASGEWRGKAGAYGIQDPTQDFLHLVDGDFDTVVGLHVAAVRRLLDGAGGA